VQTLRRNIFLPSSEEEMVAVSQCKHTKSHMPEARQQKQQLINPFLLSVLNNMRHIWNVSYNIILMVSVFVLVVDFIRTKYH
jgi:hypothetical protein